MAQFANEAHVAQGTIVRVTYADGRQTVAAYDGTAAEGLRLRYRCEYGCDSLTTTPWSTMRRLDAQVRTPGSWTRTAIGGIAGGAATYLVLLAVANGSSYGTDVGVATTGPAIVGGGVLLGAMVGWSSSRYQWRQVWP